MEEKHGKNLASQVNWPTITASTGGSNNNSKAVKERGHGTNLQGAVKWTTPVATDQNRNTKYQQGGTPLSMQAKNWPTPATRDEKGSNGDAHFNTKELPNMVKYVGQHVPENNNTTGSLPEQSQGRLNPIWVSQLMGFHFEKIYYVHLAMR